ncbi:MAG: T9SS type A sorting domain-containing protein [Ferruginibacter sp.]
MKKLYILFLSFLFTITVFAQWNPNTLDNLEIAGINVADQQVAHTSDGKTWIAFYNNNAGNYDMRAQLLDVNGDKLLGPDGVLVSNQTSGSATYVFNVALDASNNLIIAFQFQLLSVNNAVVTKVNTDGSLPWGALGTVLGPGLAPYPVELSTGEIVVTWNNNSPGTLYMQKLSAAGAVLWGSPVAITVSGTNTTRGQLLANPGGYFTLIFQKKISGISTTLYAQRYNNAGVAQWASATQLTNQTTSGVRYYSVLIENDTCYVGYYASLGFRFYAYLQRINPDGILPYGINGAPFSSYGGVSSDPYQQNINVAKTPGSNVAWGVCTYSNTSQSQYGVFVQKFDVGTGNRLLDPLGKEVFPISTNMDTQTGVLALYNDAPVFMSYDANYKIYATRLDANGNFVWAGNRVELSSTTAGGSTPKGRFAFTSMINTQAVAVWYENRGTEYRSYAQNILANGLTGVLPVSFGDFNIMRRQKTTLLVWNTETENNSRGFYLERSGDGIHFSGIAFIATMARGGNSSSRLSYSYIDNYPLPGKNYYRIRQEDLDAKTELSNTLLLNFASADGLSINSIYSTAASNTIVVNLQSNTANEAFIKVYNSNGALIRSLSSVTREGNNMITINVSNLAKAVYVVSVNSAGLLVSEKFFVK